MPRYVYQVRDAVGRSDTGVVAAPNRLEASRTLRRDGKVIVSLEEEVARLVAAAGGGRKKRLKKDDVIYFATQLAVMVETGVPLAEALDGIAEQSNNPSLQVVIEDLCDQVKGGLEFSAALERHPKIFNRLFVALMRASEVSGTMGQMLQRASEHMAQERETRNRVKGALTYPVCMLSFCVLVVIGLLMFILPRFEKIYAGRGAMLPLPTRMLMALSTGLVTYWPLVLGALAAAGVGAWFYFRSPSGSIFLDTVRVRLPVLGQMHRKACLARSLRTMATMVSTGVTMLEGLAITAEVAGNYHYRKIWLGLAEGVKEGQTLSDQLSECDLVPRSVCQMIAAGERTGKLDAVMNRVAGFCEDELKISIKTITSLIEPVMIMIMGLIVGGIAMALLLPIFSISRVVAR